MTFKVRRRKSPKPEFFTQQEIARVKRKRKGKFQATVKTGTKIATGVNKRIFKKGRTVEYKDNLAKVERVTNKGIHIRVFKRDKDGFPTIRSKKTKFVSTEEVQKGKVNPPVAFSNIPLPLFLPIPVQFSKK